MKLRMFIRSVEAKKKKNRKRHGIYVYISYVARQTDLLWERGDGTEGEGKRIEI